jgi:putative oxidoreductase
MKIGRLLLRLTVGGFFVGHGTQKMFGWFGGHGLAAGVAEAGGGAALALGLATPLAAGTLTSVMLTAIHRVHLKNGPWATNGGYEYNAVLIAAVLALAEVGPGDVSLDHLLGTERSGPAWALLAAAMGVAGAVGAHQAAAAYPAPPAPPAAPANDAGPAEPAEPAGEPTTAPS